jgi:hypothetical protein
MPQIFLSRERCFLRLLRLFAANWIGKQEFRPQKGARGAKTGNAFCCRINWFSSLRLGGFACDSRIECVSRSTLRAALYPVPADSLLRNADRLHEGENRRSAR